MQEVIVLITKEVQLKGARRGAQAVKEKAEKAYYENPNVCEHCGKVIELNGHKPCQTRQKRFCGHSCAASFNNKVAPKRHPEGACTVCGTPISSSRQYCNECLINFYRQRMLGNTFAKRDTILPSRKISVAEVRRAKHIEWVISILKLTKDELKEKGKHPYHHKSTITRIARELYRNSERKQECCVCNRKEAVDVCHIKDVREFPGSSLISEINDLNNLVALCKNHHWDFDHGRIIEEEIRRLLR
jgi:hypothetical protein